MLWRLIRNASTILVAASALVGAIAALVYLPKIGAPPIPYGGEAFSQAEFITTILSAVTVILAALAIVLALAGAVGYVTIRDATVRAAESKAAEIAASVAEKIASTTASSVAFRTAENVASQVSGQGQDAGTAFASAAGESDANGSH